MDLIRRSATAARDPWNRLPSWGWLAFLALGAVLCAGYFLLPSAEQQDVYYQLPEMLAISAILFGIHLHRPADPRPWYLFAVGVALSTTGDWTWLVLDRVFGIEPFPSVADVFYLGGMAAIAIAVLALVRGRVPGGDRTGFVDSLIVTLGVGLVSWVFLMAPIVEGELPFLEVAVALAYPLLDLLLLVVLVRLLLAPGRQVASMRLIIGGFLAYLVADSAYAVLALTDSYAVGQVIDLGWLLGAVLWGASALHPSMREVARPVTDREVRFSAWRLLLLTGASLMAPAVLVAQWLSGEPIDVPVVAAGCVGLFVLVIVRLATVVDDLRTTLDQRRQLERELERRALHDPLTGLANRTLLHDRLTHALARREGSVAVMFLDLDDFKTVNDAYGHAAGDEVLRTVSTALGRALRPEDTVARLGGDEFAILLADSPNQYEASLVAGRLLGAIQVPIEMRGGDRHTIGVSIGLSLGACAEPGSPEAVAATADSLMRDADIAMYVAKGQGKGTFVVFEPTEHEVVVRGLELRNDLEQGVRERQFKVWYQPIFDLDSGAVSGVEALVRWQHPVRGLLEPAEFVMLAEATGAIVPLGRWILEEAAREAASWSGAGAPGAGAAGASGAGASGAPPHIAVNLSAIQLADPAFPGIVADVLAATGLAPARLVLELTETARLDAEVAALGLRELRALGVKLAIDDFGTGYAALTHLSRTPFDVLKIDGSFVAPIASDPHAEAVVGGILDLARRLSVPVVAEGIEDGVQLARLRAAGCDMGQGYHLARPMPPDRLHAFFRESARTDAAAARAGLPVTRPGLARDPGH